MASLQIPTQLHSQVGLQGIRSRSKPSKSGIELTVSREQTIREGKTLSSMSPAKTLNLRATSSAVAFETLQETSENVTSQEIERDIGEKNKRSKPASSDKMVKETENISRHMDLNKPTYDHSDTGFLWSWNFTISKRWKDISKTGATGDIAFMDRMLADFRAFCANQDNRLKDFWDDCWSHKLTYEEELAKQNNPFVE